jgi:transposase
MAFREVAVTEIREVLRAWLSGAGLRQVAARAGVDRKTARRYVAAAVGAGLARDGGLGQLSDELVGQVAEVVRPVRPGGHGLAWDQLEACRAQIEGQVKAGLSVVKIGVLLERQGIVVPYRTLHRFCAERCGYGRTAATTVRVADGEPGMECQLDFGYLGLLADPVSGRQRKVQALIFTACYSRHMFVWLSFTQTLGAFIAGCEAAWVFFGGVFKVLVPDNASAIVADADAVNPRFTAGWLDYAQHCGFATDAARVRSPKDKPRVAYCTSSGRSVRSSGSGWSGVFGTAADLRPVGRVTGVGWVVEELSLVVIAGAGDNPGSAPGLDGVVVDAVGGGGFGEGEHAGVAEALAAAA